MTLAIMSRAFHHRSRVSTSAQSLCDF